MDQPVYKEKKSSLENDLYQQITWPSIIDSIISKFKDSAILVSPEDVKKLSGGYFSKSPWKNFEIHRGDQEANIILKSYCAIYSKSYTGQVKVISFYSDSEEEWIRFRMIELLNRYSQKLIEFDWNDNFITLYDINNEKKWVFQWEKKNFKGKKNADLWKRFLLIYQKHNVSFQWVKGHAGHPENEKCDLLAVEASDFKELLIDQGYEQSIDPNTLF